jgi:hypothetical protein
MGMNKAIVDLKACGMFRASGCFIEIKYSLGLVSIKHLQNNLFTSTLRDIGVQGNTDPGGEDRDTIKRLRGLL